MEGQTFFDAEVALDARNAGMSVEDFIKMNPDRAPKVTEPTPPAGGGEPPANPTPPAPAEPPANPTPPAGNEPPAPSAPLFDFSKYGLKDENDLQEKLSEYGKLSNRIKEIEPIFNEVQNPFADSSLEKINTFMQKTGIKDVTFAHNVVSLTPEDIAKDPIKAIAIADVLANPSLAQMGLSKVQNIAARSLGIDLSGGYEGLSEEEKDTLQYKALGAMKLIEEKNKEIAEHKGYFASLQSNANERASAYSKNKEEWSRVLPDVASNIKLEHTFKGSENREVKVSLALSNDMVQNVVNHLAQNFVGGQPTQENIEQLKNQAIQILRLANMDKMMEDALAAWESKYAADIEQKVRLGQHNAPPVQTQGAPPAGGEAPKYYGQNSADARLEEILKNR